MRKITSHIHSAADSQLVLEAVDERGAGNANHHYRVSGFDAKSNPAFGEFTDSNAVDIVFQNGPILESGVNGITNEVLLAIVLDRLNGFQQGEFKSRENALAITKIEEAMHWLHHRTREREARGVEGTHKV